MQSFNTIVLFSSMALFSLFACKTDKTDARELQQTYFYPASDQPYVYIYQDSIDPYFELFERIVTYHDPLGKHLLIERYNANFTLVESFDLLAERDFQVLNHILYSGNKQIVAEITDSTFMPWHGKGTFASNFPGSVDSILFYLQNKRSLLAASAHFVWDNETRATRIFTDSIFSIALDLKNQKEKAVSAVAFHEFAAGLGRVRIRTADGKSNLVLKKILSEDEWKTLITK